MVHRVLVVLVRAGRRASRRSGLKIVGRVQRAGGARVQVRCRAGAALRNARRTDVVGRVRAVLEVGVRAGGYARAIRGVQISAVVAGLAERSARRAGRAAEIAGDTGLVRNRLVVAGRAGHLARVVHRIVVVVRAAVRLARIAVRRVRRARDAHRIAGSAELI